MMNEQFYKLYHGDCLEILPMLEAESVDAVVTDPPFGVGFDYGNNYDDTINGYGNFVWTAICNAERVVRIQSPVMVWQAAKNIRHLAKWFPRQWRLFIAAKNFAQIYPGPAWYAFDPIVVWWKEGNGKGYGDVLRDFFVADTTPSGRKKRNEIVEGHPCPRPIQHLNWVINGWVAPSGIVLDPFMGSGTTGVACVQTGRSFMGIEIDEIYFNIAKERIEKAWLETEEGMEP